MKSFLKITSLSFGVSILLTSCFSANPKLISVSPEKIDKLPLKNTPLTTDELKEWNQADLMLDTVPGMSVNRAYNELLKGRKSETVVVGVIDSGIDINHEDLKGKIWVNADEKPNNGIDDDKNGYVDDINGWNFLGDVVTENMEYIRIIRDYKGKFEGKKESEISETDLAMFKQYEEAKKEYEKDLKENNENIAQYVPLLSRVKEAHEFATKQLNKSNYTQKEAFGLVANTMDEQNHKQAILGMFGNVNEGDTFDDFVSSFEEYVEVLKNKENTYFNVNLNARKKLGDNEKDLTKIGYGNNKVQGPDPKMEDSEHGTHVAGIIAANRKNKLGGKGIAEKVKIMAIRAVPDGDEYDKDIALALRYAVDNGAKVINTSFGKYFSQNPEWVREAIKYAAEKDVLIVNAAGNDAKDIDTVNIYPNDQTDAIAEVSDNFITVGALNFEYGTSLVASFSNYGKDNVDVFAPGVKIYATTPLNKYQFMRGTSMAAPAVSGVAAVLRSYFPSLSAKQIKQIIMESGNATKTNVSVGETTTAAFSDVSKSGKMVNLFNAVLLAQKQTSVN